MKIIITEEQFDSINKEELKKTLFKYWDIQKKKGNKPKLDDIVFGIANVKKHSSEDHKLIRPIWYEYNGGYEKLFLELKEKTKRPRTKGSPPRWKRKRLETTRKNNYK